MEQPNDRELYRQLEESHTAHFGFSLEGQTGCRPVCPRCSERNEPRRDLHGDACEACVVRDCSGEIIQSEEGVL